MALMEHLARYDAAAGDATRSCDWGMLCYAGLEFRGRIGLVA